MKTHIKQGVSRIKDPGSAITHFIAMVLAICATAPLLLKAAREPDHVHFISLMIFILSMIGLYAASTIYHSLDISPKVNQLLRKLHPHRRHLHSGMHDRAGRQDRLDPAGSGLGHCHCGHHHQRLLDHLPQVVLFPDLHRYGLGVHPGVHQDRQLPVSGRLRLASGGRHHLHRGRSHLCPKAPVLQLQA